MTNLLPWLALGMFCLFVYFYGKEAFRLLDKDKEENK